MEQFLSIKNGNKQNSVFSSKEMEKRLSKLRSNMEKEKIDAESIDISDQVIRLSQSGTTAWFSEIADWNIRIGDDTDSIKGIRITGVLEKQAGRWKIVQFHTSAPVAGQIIEY